MEPTATTSVTVWMSTDDGTDRSSDIGVLSRVRSWQVKSVRVYELGSLDILYCL